MRRFLFLTLLVGITALTVYSAPARAQAPGPCSAANGLSFSTAANQAFITPVFQFQPGDTIVYDLTYSFPSFTPTAVNVSITLNPSPLVAQADFSTNPLTPSATVSYTFTAATLTALRFDWSFSGNGSFAPHNIITNINCGQQAATIPTLSQWAMLLLTLALATAGVIHLLRR